MLTKPSAYLLTCVSAKGQSLYRLSRSKAINELEKKDYFVLQKKPISLGSTKQRMSLHRGLFSHLLDALGIGSSLASGVAHLKYHAPTPLLRAVFGELLNLIQQGKTLSKSISLIPIEIDDNTQALIKQGEQTNQLCMVLERLIASLDSKMQQSAFIRKKTIYPIFLLCFLILFFHFLLLELLPNTLSLYESMGRQASSLLLWLGGNWNLLLLTDTLLGAILVIGFHPRLRNIRDVVGQYFYAIPMVASLRNLHARINWLCVFILQLKANISVASAWRQATRQCPAGALNRAFASILTNIESGVPLSTAILDNPMLPAAWGEVFRVGVDNNNLSVVCERLYAQEASHYDAQISRLISWVEPGLLIIMGLAVLGVIVLLYAPILSIYSSSTGTAYA